MSGFPSDGLFRQIMELHQRIRSFVLRRYERSLPLAEELTDRWERAEFLGFGEGSSIYDSAIVYGDIKVGINTWVGPGVILDGTGGLEIGSYCSISAGVQIYSHDSVQWAITGGRAPYEKAPVRIGSRCYIGPNTVIAKGVTIGDGCVIGAQSLVLDHVPAGSKAYGSPCRVRGTAEASTGEQGRSSPPERGR